MLFHWTLLAAAAVSINVGWFSFMFNVLFETSFKCVPTIKLQIESSLPGGFRMRCFWVAAVLLVAEAAQSFGKPQVSKIHQYKRIFQGSSIRDEGCCATGIDFHGFDTVELCTLQGVANTVVVE